MISAFIWSSPRGLRYPKGNGNDLGLHLVLSPWIKVSERDTRIIPEGFSIYHNGMENGKGNVKVRREG
jgi:hypothetical protein